MNTVRRILHLLLLTLLLPPAAPVLSQDLQVRITDIDISQFPSVRVKFNITRNNSAVPNLSSAVFTLDENGVRQIIDRSDCAGDSATRLSIGLLIDRSGSMTQKLAGSFPIYDSDSTKIRAAKAAVRVFLDKLGPNDEAGVFSFSSPWNGGGARRYNLFDVNQDFTKDVTALKNSLVPIKAEGGTYLWRSVNETINRTKVRPGKKIVIVLTDGRGDQQFDDRLQSAIDNALAARIPVYTIGLGADVSQYELTEIANRTGGKYYKAPDASTLQAIYLDLARLIITDGCELQYTSSNPCLDGTRRDISLTVRVGSFSAEADSFFVVPNSRTTYTVAVDKNIVVTAGDPVEVPVYLREIISDQEALNLDADLRYDPGLLSNPRLRLLGTICEGSAIAMQEPTPGLLRFNVQGFTSPRVTSGALFKLEFDSRVVRSDTLTIVEVINADLHQRCPSVTQTESGSVQIIPCRMDFVLSSDSLLIAMHDQEFTLPLYCTPAPRFGEAFDLSFDVVHDPSLAQFVGVDRQGQSASMKVTQTPGGAGIVRLRFQGVVQDTSVRLCTLRFRVGGVVESLSGTVQLVNPDLVTRCVTTLQVPRINFLVNGACRQIARSSRKKPFLTGTPNPFNPSTTLTFNVLQGSWVELSLYDSEGRRLSSLINNHLEPGEYSIRLDGSDLASGGYYAILRTNQTMRIHRAILLR